jgi:hypothetical protein
LGIEPAARLGRPPLDDPDQDDGKWLDSLTIGPIEDGVGGCALITSKKG